MGLFKNIGRKVEEFKRTSEAVAAEEAKYECVECGKRLYTHHDECPDCGGTVVERENEADADRNEAEPNGSKANGAEDEQEKDDLEEDEAESTGEE